MTDLQNPLALHLSKYKIILASNSPRRKELLAQLGLDFTVRTLSDVDESYPQGLTNEETACYIARKKAEAHAAQMAEDELIITADTIVCSEGRVLGKPADASDAKQMLKQLAGRTHQVVTGVAIVTQAKQQTFAVTSDVTFAPLTDAEIDFVIEKCKELGVNVCLSTVWADGGKGGVELAKEVVRLCEEEDNSQFSFSYNAEDTIEQKIKDIVTKVYGGEDVAFLPAAKKQIAKLTEMGYGNCPICVAKTQYSFSDDPTKLGAPEGFTVTVRNVKVSAGAGFIVVLTGDIMTMPGLPKSPAAERIDVDAEGRITGLF